MGTKSEQSGGGAKPHKGRSGERASERPGRKRGREGWDGDDRPKPNVVNSSVILLPFSPCCSLTLGFETRPKMDVEWFRLRSVSVKYHGSLTLLKGDIGIRFSAYSTGINWS